MRNITRYVIAFRYRDRSFRSEPTNRSRSTGIGGHDKSESSVTIRRNDRSRSSGIPMTMMYLIRQIGHDQIQSIIYESFMPVALMNIA
jgi:hypothetical protein